MALLDATGTAAAAAAPHRQPQPQPPPTPPAADATDEEAANYVLHEGRALGSDLSAYLDYDPARYEAILQAKVDALLPLFAPFMAADAGPPEVFRSPARHHRLRAKLGVGVLPPSPSSSADDNNDGGGGGEKGAGTAAATRESERLAYLMWDPEGRPVPVADFPVASRRINALMPRLLAALERGPPVLRRGLRAVNFMDTLAGEDRVLVSLMYKVPIADGPEESWAPAARRWLRDGLGIQVVGRSRGVVIPLDRAYVMEALDISRPPDDTDNDTVAESRPLPTTTTAAGAGPPPLLRYKQVEGAFSNPNGHMAVHTLRWLCGRADALLPSLGRPCDLLELYCGNGNHTMALARRFRRVVGVEINRHLVAVARENLALNGIKEGTEAVILQIPAEKFHPSRLAGYRRRQRQEQQQGEGEGEEPPFDFGCVLVDPPRAGLDRYTRRLVSRYDHVLYISCGPYSLLRDLQGEDPATAATASPEGRKHLALAPVGLGSTHEVVAMAVLDHFPYTTHIEAAVHLRRRGLQKEKQQRGAEEEGV